MAGNQLNRPGISKHGIEICTGRDGMKRDGEEPKCKVLEANITRKLARPGQNACNLELASVD